MSKSTPLNQIPSNFQGQPSGQFVNDQQRQMITQAQQAAQNFTMPQNSQLQPDIVPDNDNSIQDMLNELNGNAPIQDSPQMMMYHQQHLPQPNMMENPLLNDQPNIQMMYPQNTNNNPTSIPEGKPDFASLLVWNNDLKLVIVSIGLFIVVSVLPIEKYVFQYIALDHIPYSNVLIKAVIFGVVLFVLTKIVLV